MRTLLVIAALLASVPAVAAPKGRAAKAAFQRGVAAYQKGNFAAASAALAQSYKLEADLETLFAWAQSERQQDKCESAVELYDKLLDMNMPDENKEAVRAKLDECKAIIAAKTAPAPEPTPVEPPTPEEPARTSPPTVEEAPRPRAAGHTPWWKDPIGDVLTIGGVVALGVGGYFLYSGKQAEDRSKENDAIFEAQQDKAKQHGTIGVVLTATGGALIVGGIVRYVTRSSGERERTNVTGWVTPDGGGLAAFGRF